MNGSSSGFISLQVLDVDAELEWGQRSPCCAVNLPKVFRKL